MFDFFQVIPQPDIELMGVLINEPTTSATGLILGAVCLYFGQKIAQMQPRTPYLYWMLGFFSMLFLSNAFGSTLGHAFQSRLGLVYKLPSWLFGALAATCVAQASLYRYMGPGERYQYWTKINVISTILLFLGSAWKLSFIWIEAQTAVGILGLMLVTEWVHHRQQPNAVSYWMMLAVVPLLVAVLMHIVKFTVGPWFNFFDMGHLCMCVTAWYFYRAAEEAYAAETLQLKIEG